MTRAADREGLLETLRRLVPDERVLAAVGAVPRERFVDQEQQGEAYANRPLEIGCGQTISQPLVVARMCALLELGGDELVLDVGTGSGYHAAVLAKLARHVHSVERHAELSAAAAVGLAAAGIENVTLHVGDGTQQIPDGPYDAINVAAAARRVPERLVAALAPGGRMVIPLKGAFAQRLALLRRESSGRVSQTVLEAVRFVSLEEN